MNISDIPKLMRLTDRYGLGHRPTMEAVLERLHEFADDDLAEATRILKRLPDRVLRAGVRHAAFPDALERFIQTSGVPRPRACAFIKLGVPVRGLVLPRIMREALSPTVHTQDGALYVDGVVVDLQDITLDQHLALRKAVRRGPVQ